MPKAKGNNGKDLKANPQVDTGEYLTTDQGVRVSDDQNSLTAGSRGPTLLEDFHFREKITQFDHERIPERVVHARGSGAHGYFQVYEPLTQLTMASFLQDPAAKTPVFVRFSTVNGSRGSADTVRDARGFATKFYTEDGVFDLVGNNIPVFFIQDAIKFPDLVHSFKPEPNAEIPQASTAHDNFWDFISLTPESTHMIMWIMSDRAIPRSFRMMEGFGVHTFRFVNAKGKSTFVKFHWKPILGIHGLVWDEAQKLAGMDPDFHRRDLWDAIESGNFPEYELGVQLLDEKDEFKFDFDILDATKIWPEDLVPVRRIGRLVLNRNPENFFAETEQIAFHPGNVVPGIDFTNDPLLQGRLFSYLDTQLNRFGTPNFHQLPINQPKAEVNNFQQDGAMRYANRPGKVNYERNSQGGKALEVPADAHGYVSYPQKIEGPKVRERSKSFGDHFSQATLFWNSISPVEKEHIIEALQFELGKVTVKEVQQRMVLLLANVADALCAPVATALGLPIPRGKVNASVGKTKGLSMEEGPKGIAKGRKVAILAADGVNDNQIIKMRTALKNAGAQTEIVSPHLGVINTEGGQSLQVDKSLLTVGSVMYDAVYIPGGTQSVRSLSLEAKATHFISEAYKHCKAIAATGEGTDLLSTANIQLLAPEAGGIAMTTDTDPGLIVASQGANMMETTQKFVLALGQHRNFYRWRKEQLAA